jgi:hypothetical protein
MEDKQKLTAAILSAIVTYLQIEQASSTTPLTQSPKEAEGQQRNYSI